MDFYPLFADIRETRCLIAGGGAVALRKAAELYRMGARLTVIAPVVERGFEEFSKNVRIIRRKVKKRDIQRKYFLIFSATSDQQVNSWICERARRRNIPVNSVDQNVGSSFIVPAVVRRGHLQIAISTSGASPWYARSLKEKIEAQYGQEYEVLLAYMEELRPEVLNRCDRRRRRAVFERMASDETLEMITKGVKQGNENLLHEAKARMKGTIDEEC
jgi:precorrin-2 dehydrogenase/sirohydrochlorin ferrochelatase